MLPTNMTCEFRKILVLMLSVVPCFMLGACVESFNFPTINSPQIFSTPRAAAVAAKAEDTTTIVAQADDELVSIVVNGVPIPGEKPKRAVLMPRLVHKSDVKTEDLLDAGESFGVVEQNKSYDPAQAHLDARSKVNTKRRSKDEKLAAHFEPNAVSGQDGKMRVLKIEQQNTSQSFTENRTKSYGSTSQNGVFNKVSSLFLGEDEEASSVEPKAGMPSVIPPPDLPSRKITIAPLASDEVAISEPYEEASFSNNVVIPKRKPIVLSHAAKASVYNAVAPRYGQVRKTQTVYSSDVGSDLKTKRIVYNYEGPSGIKSSVSGLRGGTHPDKTRVVIDVTKPTSYKAVVDPLRNVLKVKIENVHWHIAEKGKMEGSALLGTYITRQEGADDILLEIRLKNKAELVYTDILEPNFTSKYRIVMDLAKP